MSTIPECYLDVADALNRVREVPAADVEAWWNQFHAMLTGGGRTVTAAGYTALKEMQRTLDPKAAKWDAWMSRLAPESALDDLAATMVGRRFGRLTLTLPDVDDQCHVLDLIDCGFTREDATARVLHRQMNRACRAINRADVLETLLELVEDFGIVEEWAPLRARYPAPEGRVNVRGFGTLPEAAAALDGCRLAPPMSSEEKTRLGEVLFGPAPDQNFGDALADLFPAAPTPPPPGVDERSHRRALTISGALAAHVETHGAFPDFPKTGAFKTWAGDQIGFGASTAWAALTSARIASGAGTSGVVRSGLDNVLDNLLAYWKAHGPDAGKPEAC